MLTVKTHQVSYNMASSMKSRKLNSASPWISSSLPCFSRFVFFQLNLDLKIVENKFEAKKKQLTKKLQLYLMLEEQETVEGEENSVE